MIQVADAQPLSFEEALQQIQGSPSLRKIKSYFENSDLSADMKALLYDLAQFTLKIGEKVVALGRYIISLAEALIKKYPSMMLAVAVGAVIVALTGSALGGIPVIGALGVFLSKIAALLGVVKGLFEDLRQNVAKSELDRVAEQFSALNMGFVKQ